MAVNTCSPCSDPCVRNAAGFTEEIFRYYLIQILCSMSEAETPSSSSLIRINGTYNGTDQSVLAAPGAGKKYILRSLILGTEASDTSWSLGSKVGTDATVAQSPSFDYLSNAGLVANDNKLGWLETEENAALVITSDGDVDLLGVAQIVPA